MSLADRFLKAIRKKTKHGFAGYPVATVAYYGPDDVLATKIAVGIVLAEGHMPADMRKWVVEGRDIRKDHGISEEVLKYIRSHGTKSVVMSDGIVRCPHEEGIDYPVGTSCPACPFWRESEEREPGGDDA